MALEQTSILYSQEIKTRSMDFSVLNGFYFLFFILSICFNTSGLLGTFERKMHEIESEMDWLSSAL